MRFSSFIALAVAVASSSALFIPATQDVYGRELDSQYVQLSSRTGNGGSQFLGPGQSAYSTSSGSSTSGESLNTHSNPASQAGSHHGSNSGSNSGSVRGNSPASFSDHSESSGGSISGKTNLHMSETAHHALGNLGATQAQMDEIEREHKKVLKDHLKATGATHGVIHRLAHSVGSTDPNIHITAELKKPVQHAHGQTLDTIPSTYHQNGQQMTGTNHHVYVNPANPAAGADFIKQHMPTYHAVLKNKQGITDPNAHPNIRRRALRRRALLRRALMDEKTYLM